MPPAIPDRWIDYKPVGQKIEGTRFIAFKVPLREHISKTLEKDIRLDGKILLKSIPNLGLIIDLTNTTRYYDPNFYKNMGVEYEKLMIPGHDTPHKALVDKFKKLVKEFLENNSDNDKLIGVHCTHGVNRTGYLICNYMITEMAIDPNEAICRFGNARGHKIERINYVNALLASNNIKSKTSNRNEKEDFLRESRKRKQKEEVSDKLYNWRDRDEARARDDLKSKTSNRKEKEHISGETREWKYKEEVSAKPNHLRDRGEFHSRDRYDSRRRSSDRYGRSSKSLEAYKRDRYGSRSQNRSHRRDRYGSNRSPNRYNRRNSSPRHCHNTGNYNKYHYQIKNRVDEVANNSYQHLPEAHENVKNLRPALTLRAPRAPQVTHLYFDD